MSTAQITTGDAASRKHDCQGCYEPLLPPVFQCFNGHLLCNQCIEKVSTCPICRDELPHRKIKALAVENMIRDSWLPCPLSSLGCKQLFISSQDIDDHQLCCSYAFLNFCSIIGLGCDTQVRKDHLLDHFNSHHEGGIFSNYVFGDELEISDDRFIPFGENGKGKHLSLIHTEDQFFVLQCVDNEKEKVVSWKVLLLGPEKIARQFVSSIKIIPAPPSDPNRFVSLEWKGPVLSVQSKDEIDAKTLDSFSVPYEHFCTLFSFPGVATERLKWRIALKIQTLQTAQKDTQTPATVHAFVYCDGCNPGASFDTILMGTRYKCIECADFDLCQNCMDREMHAHHLFVIIPHPEMSSRLPDVLRSFKSLF